MPATKRASNNQTPVRPLAGLAQLRAPVAAELDAVERGLDELIGASGQLAADALSHIHQAGGKRLRPLVCLLSAGAVGDPPPALTCAIMVEALHVGSLLHDDVVDESDTRRGRDTVRKRWGNRVSVLAGDYLAARAYHSLAIGANLFALNTLAAAVGRMCEAELLYAQQNGAVPTEERYLDIAAGKTAALIEAAARLGAHAAGADDALIAVLGEFGRCLGMAFQIGDDLLDLYGNADAMGKPNGEDILAGQFTLPVIIAVQADTTEELLRAIEHARRAGRSGDWVPGLAGMVEGLGGRAYAEGRMREFAVQAQEALGALPQTAARTALLRLADLICTRRS